MTRPVSEFDARMEVKAFIDRARAPYGDWYVGVAVDAEARIAAHGLRENDWYIERRLESAEAAQRVAEFVLKLGCEGSSSPTPYIPPGAEISEPISEEGEATSVYAYWKRGHTQP